MKLNSEINELFTNTGESKGFAISASATAFKILSSQIYENKIKAVVRELSCNAYDSHMQAGKEDEPFTVHLPNAIEPWFEVSDKGVGLSEEQVFDLYTTYFKSTKQDSNDFIGGLGLGSKSPFSYVDQFIIASTFDGVKCVYSAFVGTDGSPHIVKVHNIRTTEGNGVSVKLPVKPGDFHAFKHESKMVLKWFTIVPIVVGQDVVIESVKQENDYYIIPGDNSRVQKFYAVMGNVAYPTDFREHPLWSPLSSIHGALAVEFNIGELEVSASRETLSLTKETEEVIRRKLNDVASRIREDAQNDIDRCDSLADIRSTKLSNYIMLRKQIFTFKGIPLTNYVKTISWEGTNKDKHVRFKKLHLKYGRKTASAVTESFVKLDPFESKNYMYKFLVLDSKKYVTYNITEFCRENKGSLLFACDKEDIGDIKSLFEYVNVEFEYLSDRITKGCKPTPTQRSSALKGSICYVITNEIIDKQRFTLKELKGKIDNIVGTAYVAPINLRNGAAADFKLDMIKKVIDDDVVVITCSESNYSKLLTLDKVKRYEEAPIHPNVIAEFDKMRNQVNYRAAAKSMTRYLYSRMSPDDLEYILDIKNDMTENYRKLNDMCPSDPLAGDLTFANTFEGLAGYKGGGSHDDKEVKSIVTKFQELMHYVNIRYPLMSYTFLIATKKDLYDHCRNYVRAVNANEYGEILDEVA